MTPIHHDSAAPHDALPAGSSATLTATHLLRRRILVGAIRPGTTLSQVQLARELGVSTTPLREAMRMLQAEGLLELQPNRRARVAVLDVADLDAVYAARVLLEGLAITVTVERLDDDRMAALSAAHDELRRHAGEQAVQAWSEAHQRFHHLLVSGAPEPLREMIAGLMQRAERYRMLSVLGSNPRVWGAADDEHQRIVAACAAGEAVTAARELGLHLGRTALTLNAQLAPEVDALSVRKSLELIAARSPEPR